MNILAQIGKDLSHQAETRKILFSMPKECSCNHYQYRKTSIKPPGGLIFFQALLRGGGGGFLIWRNASTGAGVLEDGLMVTGRHTAFST